MNQYEAKQEARRERLQERAAKKRQQSDSLAASASKDAAAIPFGQPILVGHHSEKRDRNFRGRIQRRFEKAHELDQEAKALEGRAASVGTGGVSSDDPDAIDKLREHLAEREAKQERMKATNRAARSKTDPEGKLAAMGYSKAEIHAFMNPSYSFEKPGHQSWELSNNGAQIRRLKQRIANLEARAGDVTRELVKLDGLTVTDNVEDNRVQLDFDGKPSEAIRTQLKRNGFRWARSLGVWQRHRSNAATHYACEIAQAYHAEQQEAEAEAASARGAA